MKLQPASQKEVIRMAKGCGVCAVLAVAGFFLLDQFKIVPFTYRVLVGIAGGTVISVFNFALLCIMVQNAAGTEDKKLLKAKVQLSYNLRLALQAGWVVLAFLNSHISVLAAAVPLLFPTAVIQYLRSKGKLVAPTAVPAKKDGEEPKPLPEHPGPFED